MRAPRRRTPLRTQPGLGRCGDDLCSSNCQDRGRPPVFCGAPTEATPHPSRSLSGDRPWWIMVGLGRPPNDDADRSLEGLPVTTHRLEATTWHNTLGTHEPALRCASGDIVVTETLDAAGFDRNGVARAQRPNPVNGPIFVEGAEPGDALRVEILRMTPTRDTGWTFAPLAANVVDPGFVRFLPAPERFTWTIDRDKLTVRLDQAPKDLEGFVLDLAPMIGCFGVAPALGQAFSNATSAENGGNMDYRRFGVGTTVWFPGRGSRRTLRARRLSRGPRRWRDRRHGDRDDFRGRGPADGREEPNDLVAAGGNRDRHLHGRQRSSARSGAAARDDRDAEMADDGFRLFDAVGESPPRAGRALRRRQRLRPRLYDGLPCRQVMAAPLTDPQRPLTSEPGSETLRMTRPVIGVIGNAYVVESRYMTQLVGTNNLRAVAEGRECLAADVRRHAPRHGHRGRAGGRRWGLADGALGPMSIRRISTPSLMPSTSPMTRSATPWRCP